MQTLEKTGAPARGKSLMGSGPVNISQLGYRDLVMTISIAIQHFGDLRHSSGSHLQASCGLNAGP
jgi:hypothetical protein